MGFHCEAYRVPDTWREDWKGICSAICAREKTDVTLRLQGESAAYLLIAEHDTNAFATTIGDQTLQVLSFDDFSYLVVRTINCLKAQKTPRPIHLEPRELTTLSFHGFYKAVTLLPEPVQEDFRRMLPGAFEITPGMYQRCVLELRGAAMNWEQAIVEFHEKYKDQLKTKE